MAVFLAALALASGLHGIVTRGPTAPVCKVGVPCSAPAVGVVLVFSRNGATVARVRTGAGGRYAVRLAPGVYTIRLVSTPRIGTGLRPTSAVVFPRNTRRVDFFVDTGIR